MLVLASGCTGAPPASGPSSAAPPQKEGAPVVAPEHVVTRLLARRERAMVADRRKDFALTTVAGSGRRAQLEVFDVLSELPVARAAYVVSSVDRVRRTEVTRVATLLLVRLDGFDARPVAATHVLDLVPTRSGWRVRRDRLAHSGLIASPWHLPGAQVRLAEGLGLILDQGSRHQGDRLVRLLQEARSATRRHVPYPLPRRLLVIAPSTVKALRDAGFQPFEIQRTGGIVAQVQDRVGEFAAERMVLVPATLRQDDDRLRNVLRHELAHLAIGHRDRGMPLWIVEGLAEWVSWRDDASFRISSAAVAAARTGGGITEMPSDIDFRGPEAGTAYGIGWFAMKWLEQEYGPGAPYALLNRLRQQELASDRAISQVLERQYGVTTDELAANAGDLIDATFE